MRAWVCRAYADPMNITLEEIPVPKTDSRGVQIAMKAAGVAFGESLILKGGYQFTPPLPYIPGNEISGVVTACGSDVTRFKAGDEVLVVSHHLSGGGMAEFMTADEAYVFHKPRRLSFAESASVSNNYLTSYNALVRRGNLIRGETLVVHGASGAVGVAAVQLGKLLGATVIGTGGDDEKLAVVTSLGADYVINYRTQPLREQLLELTDGRGADVFVDPVGGEMFEVSMRAIAPGGRILIVGFASGHVASARSNVLLVKMVSVIGVQTGVYLDNSDGVGWSDFYDLLGWMEVGRIVPYIGASFEFEQLPEAFSALLNRQVVGKCVILNE